MTIYKSERPLVWGELDVPMLGITKDWFGVEVLPAAGFSLAMDEERLWFVAHHRRAAQLHPAARPGKFQAELWRYDVAELFIADPVSGRYCELNLSPNAAWWSCEFTAPRVRAQETDVELPGVETFATLDRDGSWVAAMSIPLNVLRERFNFGEDSKANVTMILETPEQRFLTAGNLGNGEPDYHQPERFETVKFQGEWTGQSS